MKILLTGGNGFVGSHILDALRENHLSVRLLLRESSNTRFIHRHLQAVEICYGSLYDPESLKHALLDVTAVIHCAGKTKALTRKEYYQANRDGTRNLVLAANSRPGSLRQFLHISSRAVNGPATASDPACEEDEPAPVSDYGRSKMQAEQVVAQECRAPWTVLRPSGVYGPRDVEFLKIFKTVRGHLLPLFDGGRQDINLVFAPDLAGAVLTCLNAPASHGRVYNVASPEICTVRHFVEEVARALGVKGMPLLLPSRMLYPICLISEGLSRIRRRPSMLNRQKYAELSAAGWACSVDRIRQELGFPCPTALDLGLAQTLAWYRECGWLK